jgi:hypothetical protein
MKMFEKVILEDLVEKSIKINVHRCHYCGTKVPINLVGCWNCGKILSKNIRKLAKKL